MEQTQITADDFGLLEQEPEDWSPGNRVYGHEFRMPEFEMVSNPTVRLTDIRRRRFDIIDRAQETAREEIAAEEDAEIFAALDHIQLDQIVVPMARSLAEGAQAAAHGARIAEEALRRYVERWSNNTRRNERVDIIGR